MTNTTSDTRCAFERQMEARQVRRWKNDDKAFDRLTSKRQMRIEAEAEALIGELCRDGKTVYYVNTRAGKTKEGGFYELKNFLIRNNYVGGN